MGYPGYSLGERYTLGGICPGIMVGMYTPPCICPGIHPWVHPVVYTVSGVLPGTPSPVFSVPKEEALGSNL